MGDIIPREANGRFCKGKPGGPGRPRGSRNSLNEEFIVGLLADWQQHGRDAIERLRQDDVATYLKIIASICRVARVEITDSAAADDEFAQVRSREELYALLHERGGPLASELFRRLMEQLGAGER